MTFVTDRGCTEMTAMLRAVQALTALAGDFIVRAACRAPTGGRNGRAAS